MKPILFSEDATSFITNGFGRMSDAISCKVVEERNGEYELTMTYPVNGRHFSELSERMLLYSIHDDKKDRQPFRIYEISKPLNGIVTIHARHISYDLNKIVLSPFTAGSCSDAFAGIESNSSTRNPFSFTPYKEVAADFKVEVPTTCRSILGGTQGSILDVYGPGEYQWDGWNVNFYSQRGQDRPVEIRYGKNLTELEDTINIANTFNAVYPYWKQSRTDDSGNTVEDYVYLSDNPNQRVLVAEVRDANNQIVSLPLEVMPLDLSGKLDLPEDLDLTAALQGEALTTIRTRLREKAEVYLTANKPWLESRNITVSFVALWQTEEYKNLALERVSLCDTVKVIHNKLGISVRKKIIKVDYDVLNERYNSMELGDSSKSFTNALSGDLAALRGDMSSGMGDMSVRFSLIEGLITPKSEIDSAIDSAVQHAAEMIRGGLGGYVIMNANANGQPEEIVISDNLDLDQAQNVWRWNRNGLAFSNDGYDFDDEHPDTLKLALTADGQIVANRITSGSLTANIITAGVLRSANGKTSLNMTTGKLTSEDFSIETTDGGSLLLVKNGAIIADLSVWGSLYPINNYSNTIDSFTIRLADNYPFAIANDVTTEDEDRFVSSFGIDPVYDYMYRFAINDTSKRMGFNEWVYAESLFVVDHIRFGTRNGPVLWRSNQNFLLVGDEHVNECGLAVWGDLVVSGQAPKSRAVKTENYGMVRLDAVESATSLFCDIGSGVVGEDGSCLISFDPKFRETINLSHEYQVFLTLTGSKMSELRCEKNSEYFIVYGDSGASFDWIVYAKQKEFPNRRLEEWIPPSSDNTEPPMTDLEQLADQYIENYKREVNSL